MDINSSFSEIDICLCNADYVVAKKKLELIKPLVEENAVCLSHITEVKTEDNTLSSSIRIILNYAGFLIDCGSAIQDATLIESGLNYANKVFVKMANDHKLYLEFCYTIANAYSSLIQIKQNSTDQQYWIGDKFTEEAKRLYRIIISASHPGNKYHLETLTNYANLLNGGLGRNIESLHYYNLVIQQNPNFSMALANKGYVQSLLALVISGNAKRVILHESYANITKAIKCGLDEGPKQYFSLIANHLIKSMYPEVKNLSADISCESNLPEKISFENYYKRFCITNDLFLNPISNSHQCEAALYDPLIISHLVFPKEEYGNFREQIKNFNQIKQEYIFARFLLVQSFYKDSQLCFIDKDAILLNTLDSSTYGIFLEQAKTSFRISFSILDKIAFFVNQYCKLKMREKSIYFHSISPLRYPNLLKTFFPLVNPYLAALMDLSNDFENDYFKKFVKLRNSFEHRFESIYLFNNGDLKITGNEVREKSGLISLAEFRTLHLELLLIVKSAIFYLALMVDWEEKNRNKDTKEEVYSIHLPEYQDYSLDL